MLSKDSSGMPFVRKLGSWPSVRWTRFLARSRHNEVDLSYRAVAANTGCLCLCVVYLTSQMQLDAKKWRLMQGVTFLALFPDHSFPLQ
jgi:hypothetical protein